MKISALILSLLMVHFNALSQLKSNYSRGFEVGFTEGYCYNNSTVDCFYPLRPEAPLPKINEDKENYTQGYNRGFQFGLDLRRSNDALNNSNTNLNSQIIKFNEYINQNPIDAMRVVGVMKQKKYDARNDWIQERIYQLGNLINTLYSKETLPRNYDINSIRTLYWKTTINYAKCIEVVDFANDYQFNLIQTDFNKIERYYYNS